MSYGSSKREREREIKFHKAQGCLMIFVVGEKRRLIYSSATMPRVREKSKAKSLPLPTPTNGNQRLPINF